MQVSQLKNNKNLNYSLLLHLAVIIVFGFGLGISIGDKTDVAPPIIVDLSLVEIAPKTNLPAKIVKNSEKQKPSYAKPKPKLKEKPKTTPKPEIKPIKIEKAKNSKKSDIAITEKTLSKKKAEKKETVKKTPPPLPPKLQTEDKQKTKAKNDLNSLLASVEKMKPTQSSPPSSSSKVDKMAEKIAKHTIAGGIGGNSELPLAISEKDAIASKLRACWNIDAGAKGVLDIKIGIRATLNKNGEVNDVQIIDKSRYNSDKVFRALADSARRAVYVCDKKENASPFKILSKNYPNQYNLWQDLYLQFNPLDGGIF